MAAHEEGKITRPSGGMGVAEHDHPRIESKLRFMIFGGSASSSGGVVRKRGVKGGLKGEGNGAV